jgi:hypothetical protein
MIPVYLLGIFIQVRLGSAAFALPTAGDWLLALGAPLLLYLIGSALALVTPSATGTLVRLVVWGFALALGITMLRERVAAFGTLLDALSRTMFWGSTGVLTALGAGIPGFAGTAGAREATALASWMLLSLLAIRQAAGRLPRRG